MELGRPGEDGEEEYLGDAIGDEGLGDDGLGDDGLDEDLGDAIGEEGLGDVIGDGGLGEGGLGEAMGEVGLGDDIGDSIGEEFVLFPVELDWCIAFILSSSFRSTDLLLRCVLAVFSHKRQYTRS